MGSISAIVSISRDPRRRTVLFFIGAPLIIDAFTAFDHTKGVLASRTWGARRTSPLRCSGGSCPDRPLRVHRSRHRTAQHEARFVAPMWCHRQQPRVHRVLLWFTRWPAPSEPPRLPTAPQPAADPRSGHHARVAVQALLLLPRSGGPSSRAALALDPANEAVRTVVRLGSWTFGFVLANQIALFVVIALAVSAGGGRRVLVHLRLHLHADALCGGRRLGHGGCAARPGRALDEGDIPAFLRRLSGVCAPCSPSSSRHRSGCCCWRSPPSPSPRPRCRLGRPDGHHR